MDVSEEYSSMTTASNNSEISPPTYSVCLNNSTLILGEINKSKSLNV